MNCRKRLCWPLWVALLLGVGMVHGAWASRFQADLHESSWVVESSVFACSMTHSVPFYGAAVFERRAGESSHFRLRPSAPRLETGKASLVSAAPSWKSGDEPLDMGYVAVRRGESPVELDAGRSEQVLAQLFAGREVVFTRAPWYETRESSQVVLSNVNFQPAYRQYLNCLSRLLPVNFEQIQRTAIYFSSGSDTLGRAELRKLDNIATYVKADTSVEAFYIDGHTDSAGSREENLELSRRRAEFVAAMLIERGIAAERITSRWHGERYPVASNRSAGGREQNRRVTIRLERAGAPSLPSLASSFGQ